MPSSHDLAQDQRLDHLDANVANLGKRINANVRKMKQLSHDLNARLAQLAPQSGQRTPAPRAQRPPRKPRPQRGKTPTKGAKIR